MYSAYKAMYKMLIINIGPSDQVLYHDILFIFSYHCLIKMRGGYSKYTCRSDTDEVLYNCVFSILLGGQRSGNRRTSTGSAVAGWGKKHPHAWTLHRHFLHQSFWLSNLYKSGEWHEIMTLQCHYTLPPPPLHCPYIHSSADYAVHMYRMFNGIVTL